MNNILYLKLSFENIRYNAYERQFNCEEKIRVFKSNDISIQEIRTNAFFKCYNVKQNQKSHNVACNNFEKSYQEYRYSIYSKYIKILIQNNNGTESNDKNLKIVKIVTILINLDLCMYEVRFENYKKHNIDKYRPNKTQAFDNTNIIKIEMTLSENIESCFQRVRLTNYERLHNKKLECKKIIVVDDPHISRFNDCTQSETIHTREARQMINRMFVNDVTQDAQIEDFPKSRHEEFNIFEDAVDFCQVEKHKDENGKKSPKISTVLNDQDNTFHFTPTKTSTKNIKNMLVDDDETDNTKYQSLDFMQRINYKKNLVKRQSARRSMMMPTITEMSSSSSGASKSTKSLITTHGTTTIVKIDKTQDLTKLTNDKSKFIEKCHTTEKSFQIYESFASEYSIDKKCTIPFDKKMAIVDDKENVINHDETVSTEVKLDSNYAQPFVERQVFGDPKIGLFSKNLDTKNKSNDLNFNGIKDFKDNDGLSNLKNLKFYNGNVENEYFELTLDSIPNCNKNKILISKNSINDNNVNVINSHLKQNKKMINSIACDNNEDSNKLLQMTPQSKYIDNTFRFSPSTTSTKNINQILNQNLFQKPRNKCINATENVNQKPVESKTNLVNPPKILHSNLPVRRNVFTENTLDNVDYIDPNDKLFIKNFLKNKIEKFENLKIIESNLPLLNIKKKISINGHSVLINSKIAKGAFATIYNATKIKTLALKVQKPACPWECYIVNELRNRITKMEAHYMLYSFMNIDHMYVYNDASLIFYKFNKKGNILDHINRLNVKGIKHSPFFTAMIIFDLLSMVQYVRKCNIIHADIKPDNILINGFPPVESCKTIFENNDCNVSFRTCTLIDFGRSIDMNLYPNGTTFIKKVLTDKFICNEMKRNLPWTYQTDLYGLLGTINVIIFHKYMNVYFKSIKQRYIVTSNFERSHFRLCNFSSLMKDLFDSLLNIESCQTKCQLQQFRSRLYEILKKSHIPTKYTRDLKSLTKIMNSSFVYQ
ncbi:hypothetical protein A3Q56_02238 [Intoshia linei]|uniref:Protein kinase domain-containing protein n=1 Tax=Intoshia linei TaxID=1819745 RepID=A0A177B6R0_9BILA|nr:hypothetical protein A3Q56_02238 [Intoshia linei]